MTGNNDSSCLCKHMRKLDIGNTGSSTIRLIIGLDLGTTYSGIAYAFQTKPDQIYTITDWPGAKGRSVPKVPSTIKYSHANTFKWGYELEGTLDVIEGIKLMLDPNLEKPHYGPRSTTKAELRRLGKSALGVATDYIGAIYGHAMKKIQEIHTRNFLGVLEKQFVMSVPAIWSDKAKDTIFKAAHHAGLHPITLIKGPEAALISTQPCLKREGLEVGDTIVVCDAGGGIVELLSYQIRRLSPFELGELVIPSGRITDSLMLNKRFEEWVETLVGTRTYIRLRDTNGYRVAMKRFDESIKPAFRSRDDMDRYIHFPMANLEDDPAKGIESNWITLTGNTLHKIFSPVFQEFNNLLEEQIRRVYWKRAGERYRPKYFVKAIFMLGDLGSSAYISKAIADTHQGLRVIQPSDASAILRGAVMSKLPREVTVVRNIAPKHYGVAADDIFDPKSDEGQPKHYNPIEDVWRTEIMFWYIRKDEDISRGRKIEFPFFRVFDRDAPREHYVIHVDLLECDLEKQPIHPIKGVVTTNCILTADLTRVPGYMFMSKHSKSGRLYYELQFTIRVSLATKMTFSLHVRGMEICQIAAEY